MSVRRQSCQTLSLQATGAISRCGIPLFWKLDSALIKAGYSNHAFEEQIVNPDICYPPPPELIDELLAVQEALGDISATEILHMHILRNRLPQANKLVTETIEFLRNLCDEVSQARVYHTHAPSLMLSHSKPDIHNSIIVTVAFAFTITTI